MASRQVIYPALFAALLLSTVACSKSEDTAPERKLFGDPPRFVSAPQITSTDESISCEWTDAFNCVPANDKSIYSVDPTLGYDTSDDCVQACLVGINDGGQGCPTPPVFVFPEFCNFPLRLDPGPLVMSAQYQRVVFKASVTDPQSIQGKSDILLVSASFIVPDSNNEDTLILFDDGSSTQFPYKQRGGLNALEDCTSIVRDFDPTIGDYNASCDCRAGEYVLTSGDTTAGDGSYERVFAIFNVLAQNGGGFIEDCIAKKNHQAPKSGLKVGATLEFRIDVVDRAGNVTTWPTKIPLPISDTTSSFQCSGDPCLCCFITHGSTQACKNQNLQGLIGVQTPDGYCYHIP